MDKSLNYLCFSFNWNLYPVNSFKSGWILLNFWRSIRTNSLLPNATVQVHLVRGSFRAAAMMGSLGGADMISAIIFEIGRAAVLRGRHWQGHHGEEANDGHWQDTKEYRESHLQLSGIFQRLMLKEQKTDNFLHFLQVQ